MTDAQRLDQKNKLAYIRDKLIAVKRFHVKNCNDDKCEINASIIAYLAHCIGFQMHDLPQFILMLNEINNTCSNKSGSECPGDTGAHS